MDYMVFLLNMRISGIKNIEKEIMIEFAGKEISKKFNPDTYRIKCIYGENGVGKSAIISAVDIVKEFFFNENYLRDSQKQLVLKELINKKTKEFSFKCEFITNVESFVVFEYEVKFIKGDDDEVYVAYESLKYKKNSSRNVQNTMFVCRQGEFIELNIDEQIEQVIIDKTRNLLIKQSALYSVFKVLAQEHKSFGVVSYWLYATLFFIMLNTYFDREDRHMSYYHKQWMEGLKNQDLSTDNLFEQLMKIMPTGENRVPIKAYADYEKMIKRLEKFVKLFKPELIKIDIEKKEYKEFFDCELLMNYGDYRVNKEFESTGIKKIIELFGILVLANKGTIVFIDELDSNINDIYLCKLIEYFKYFGKGQLCFTSHNTDPMQVLKDNKKAIDFLTRDNRIIPWVKNGHYTPDSSYRNGMIMGLPFNIDASDFISVFEGEE